MLRRIAQNKWGTCDRIRISCRQIGQFKKFTGISIDRM